jgi:hypothetical protein
MTGSDHIRIAAERIKDFFDVPQPDPMDWTITEREHSAAQLRFISKALEQMEEAHHVRRLEGSE